MRMLGVAAENRRGRELLGNAFGGIAWWTMTDRESCLLTVTSSGVARRRSSYLQQAEYGFQRRAVGGRAAVGHIVGAGCFIE